MYVCVCVCAHAHVGVRGDCLYLMMTNDCVCVCVREMQCVRRRSKCAVLTALLLSSGRGSVRDGVREEREEEEEEEEEGEVVCFFSVGH